MTEGRHARAGRVPTSDDARQPVEVGAVLLR